MPSLSSPLSVEDDMQNNFDNWMDILQQLPHLQIQRRDLYNPAFQKLFEASGIAKFTPEEKNKYEESLKYYRDLKNMMDTAFEDGKALAKKEYKIGIARRMKMGDESIEKIIQFTGLAKEEIEKL
ncbi:MAG: PD-(D/E)XK nuclease family transposase [Saprospiraceae bacterium]|nr:PD-(D/E)XK nuclease family transposase [Saprospiraceae bacterium]